MGEQPAWANTETAQAAQEEFIGRLHNLLLVVAARLQAEGIENTAEAVRKAGTTLKAQALAAAAGRVIPHHVAAFQRLTQRSAKGLRWLGSSLLDRLARETATPRIRGL